MPFFDGTDARIYYRAWEVDAPVAGLIFLHGGGEHSGQFSRLAARLNAADINVWIPDHRGHGISGGDRGVIDDLDVLAADAVALADLVRDRFPGLPLVIGGHSLGGWTTALIISRDAAPWAGAVITGASLRGATALSDAGAGKGDFHFDTAVLAADPNYLEELEKDPLVQLVLPRPETSAQALARAEASLAEHFAATSLPVLFVNGTEDRLASIEHARHWHAALPDARLVEVEGGLHNVLNDVDHVATSAAVRDFVLDVAAVRVG